MDVHVLPKYALSVVPRYWRNLTHNIWSEKTIPALLDVGFGPQPVRLKFRGNHTRIYAKKSFSVSTGHREWHLNADCVDPSAVRSKWSFDWFSRLSVLSPRATHVLLTINGDVQGIYTLLEAVDRRFLQRRHLPVGDMYYAIDNRANFSLCESDQHPQLKQNLSHGYEIKHPHSPRSHYELERFIWNLNTLPAERLETWLRKTVAVKHYLRWLAGVVLTSNMDGFVQNYALYKHPDTEKWWIIPWDYEGTWGRSCYGDRMSATAVPLLGYNRLSRQLLSVAAFRDYYMRLLSSVLTNMFVEEKLMNEVRCLMGRVRPTLYRIADHPQQIHIFESEVDVFQTYTSKRRQYLRRELRKHITSI